MQGTKQFNYKHLLEDDKIKFVLENIVCQIDTVTKYQFLSFVAYISKFTRFLGGPNGPKICMQGTTFDFKDRAQRDVMIHGRGKDCGFLDPP